MPVSGWRGLEGCVPGETFPRKLRKEQGSAYHQKVHLEVLDGAGRWFQGFGERGLPEALDSDGVAPCHHILFISHQQHTFIYCLLCTILSPKFMYQALCTKWAFPLAQAVKNMPATKEMQV